MAHIDDDDSDELIIGLRHHRDAYVPLPDEGEIVGETIPAIADRFDTMFRPPIWLEEDDTTDAEQNPTISTPFTFRNCLLSF